MSSSDRAPKVKPGGPWYNAIWRWHFYAGMVCIPFVIWLSLTGLIYLWRPQIEAWLDSPYAHLATQGPNATPEAQVAAALAAVPGATLHRYILPPTNDPRRDNEGVRILVARDGEDTRVIVDPRSLAVLDVAKEEQRPMRLIFHLHGELMAGAFGSYLVEIAACWAVVMLLTGLILWWPRGPARLAGIVYPRLRSGSRLFWRDIHAVTGLWVSLLALGLILTGLPWAKGWGSYLAEIRTLTGTARGPVDWSIGGKPPTPDPMVPKPPKIDPMLGDHAGHHGMAMPSAPLRLGDLARVIATVAPLDLAPPVSLTPPKAPMAPWSVTSDAADRPLRAELKIDGATGQILSRTNFAQRHWIDRTIGYGVAAHEGALFGLANQILGSLTALALVLLATSGAILWWRRRPTGLLGAPPLRSRPRFGWAHPAIIALLAAYMPMFGASLLLVLALEFIVLRRLPRARRWLGLPPLRPPRDLTSLSN